MQYRNGTDTRLVAIAAPAGTTPRSQQLNAGMVAALIALTCMLFSSTPGLISALARVQLPQLAHTTPAAKKVTDKHAFGVRADGVLTLTNKVAGIAGVVGAQGLTVRTAAKASAVSLRSAAFGRAGSMTTLAAATPVATDSTASLRHAGIIEWFQNKPGVLEQGWTIAKRPAGVGQLRLDLGITGAKVLSAGAGALSLHPARGLPLTYGNLIARDSRGHRLPARFSVTSLGARILVDDAKALYPIVIDPDLSSVLGLFTPPSAAGNGLGSDVAVNGRWMAVKEQGARPDGINRRGAIDLYHDLTGNGAWAVVTSVDPGAGVTMLNLGVALRVEPTGVTVFSSITSGGMQIWTLAGDPDTVAPSATPQLRQTLPFTAGAGYGFGQMGTLAADGNLLVAGASGSTGNGDFVTNSSGQVVQVNEQIGSAQVFHRTGGFGSSYTFDQQIDPPGGITQPLANRDVGQLFGTSVSVDAINGLIAVGAPGDDGVPTHGGGASAGSPGTLGTSTNNGAVDVFKLSAGTWSQVQRLASSTNASGGRVGASVAFTGTSGGILTGAPNEAVSSVANVGAGYVFDWNGTSTWSEVQRVLPDDPSTTTNEAGAAAAMGTRVASDPAGTHLYFSAPSPSHGTGLNGSIFVVTRAGTAAAGTVTNVLVPVTPSEQHGGLAQGFGGSLAVTNNLVEVGAPSFGNLNETGAGRLITYGRSGSTYSLLNEIFPVPTSLADHYGQAVAQDGDVMAISLPNANRGSGFGKGAVAVYHRSANSWAFEQMLFPYSNIQTSNDNNWGNTLAVHEVRDAQGHDNGAVIAVGDPTDSFIDVDGNNSTPAVTKTNAGTVSFFGRDGPPGTTYQPGQKLFDSGRENSNPLPNSSNVEVNGFFGSALAFTPDGTLLVGEPGGSAGVGEVHRFDTNGPVLNYTYRQTVSGASGTTGFGNAIAADGTNVLVAPSDGSGLLQYTDGSQNTNLAANGGFTVSLTGSAMGLSLVGNRFAVGGTNPATGNREARVYRIVGTLAVREFVVALPSNSTLGSALSLNHGGSVTSLVAGAPSSSGGAIGKAWVYVAKLKSSGVAQWSQYGELLNPGNATLAQFGSAVTNWPTTGGALVGAPFSDTPVAAAGSVYGYDTSTVVPPVGPQAFVDVTLPSTVQVGAKQVKTNGLPQSLLANNALSDGSVAATSIGSIDLSQAPKGTSVSASPLSGIPLSGIPLSGIPLSGIPLSGIPLTVPGGWPAVLAGTAFDNVPLQSVTLKDVYDLPSVQALPLGALTLAGSPLASIPIASIALGDTPLSGIDINPNGSGSNITKWCDALTAAKADPAELGLDCANPTASANASVTMLSIGVKGAPLSGIPLSGIPLSGIPLSGIPLSGIPLSGIGISGSPLSGIPLSGIPLSGIPLSGIPLSGIPLSGIPLSGIPLSGIPLSGIPLSGIPLSGIPLSGIDIAGSRLSGIPLSGIPLSGIPLSGIPLSGIPLSGIPLSGIPLSGISVGGTPLSGIPLSGIDIGNTPLSGIPLSGIPLSGINVLVDCNAYDCNASGATLGTAAAAGAIKPSAQVGDLGTLLKGMRLSDLIGSISAATAANLRTALGSRSLADLTTFDNLTLGDLPQLWPYLKLGDLSGLLHGFRLSDVANHLTEFTANQVRQALDQAHVSLASVTNWDTVTLGETDVLLQYLHLGDLSSQLKGVRLGDLADAIQKPGGGTYTANDLRAALDQALPGKTFADLTDLGDLTLGELGTYSNTTLGQLLSALAGSNELDKITFGDLLLTLLNPKQYPWQALDINAVATQAFDDNPTGSPVTLAYRADAPDGLPRTVRVTVQLPHGGRIDTSSITGHSFGDPNELKPEIDGDVANWTFTNVPANAPQSLSFQMEAPLTIGPAQVKATAFLPADDETSTDAATTIVKEAYEPNDTLAQATALPDDTIELSHISQAGDIDVYKFDVTDPGTRVSISLSNLDADLDMVLYAPRVGSVVPTGGKSIDPVEDNSQNGLPAKDQAGSTTPQPSVGNDVARPSDLGNLAVVQGSFNRGRTNEQIDTRVLTRTGTYYLAVTGYNAAVTKQPYALRLKRFVSNDQPACPARTVTPGTQGTLLPQTLPTGTDTVFVVNPSRMAGLYGQAAADTLMTQLTGFTGWLNDSGLQKASVLTVDADAGVRAAYSAWDSSPCLPSGANGVVSEIARILNGYRTAGATIKNVVLVGGDDAVPFARVPDRTSVANESGYASTFSDSGNALFATFATSSVQTDNAYVDRSPYAFGDRTLYVPDATIGRLVETPDEIANQLSDFESANGKLAVGTGLVTGYDFLSDGAQAIKNDVSSTYGTVSSKISDTWTRQDLEDAIHAIKPDLLSINAHFDHYRALPGAGNTTHDESDLFQAAAVRGALNGDLAGSVVFSMGCHSGLSASDKLVSGDRALDFAQAVSSQGGVFVGNTGFGYGDTDTVALSEALMGDFAQRLNGSMTVGEALLYAKNAYFSGLAEYTPYDEKVLQETTFYGLPFYRLDVPNPPSVPAPISPIITPDTATGLGATTTHLAPTYVNRTADDGTTYTAAVDPVTGQDSLTTVQNRPVEPKIDQEYALPAGLQAHDGLVLGLTSVDTSNADPYVFQPTVDDAGERTDVGVDTAFPTRAVQVNPGLSPAGETFHVAATTGYFRTTSPDGKGLQRTYKSMDVLTYLPPAGNDDFVAPTFSQVTGSVHDGVLSVSAHTMDDRGDASRVKRVRLLLLQDPRDGVATTWRGLDLVRTAGSDEWTGSLPSSGRNLEFILQAVDAAGNVGVTTDKAQNFSDDSAVVGAVNDPTGTDDGGPVGNLALSLSGQQGSNSWYTGPVTVTASGGVKLVYEVVGESDPTGYQEPFQVSGTGLHTVRVTSGDGQTQQVTIAIDTVGPVATLTSPAPGQSMPAAPGALISYSCPDAGSGASSCTAKLDGSPVSSGSTVPLPPGQHTVVVTAGPDLAGNPASVPTLTRTFTVLGAPATVGAISVSKAQDGAVTTLSIPFTGYSVLTYSGSVTWGDGATTNCAMAGSGCTITRNAAGGGTITVTHTYNTSWVDTNATVTVIDNLGQTASAMVKVNRKTTLTATPALLQLKVGTNIVELKTGAISATLKDAAGNPLPGQTVKFTFAGGSSICTATTNLSGTATCPPNLLYTVAMIVAGRYTATFPGKDVYHGSTASASLIG